MENFEEACQVMPQYFELGYIKQHPLICIDKMILSLYKPMFEDENQMVHVSKKDCLIDETQMSSLLSDFNKEMLEFIYSTEHIISQIEKPFMFCLPVLPEDSNLEELAQETEYVTEAEEMIRDWNSVISDLFHEISGKKPPENGLFQEIEFWKTQQLKLDICADQLSHSTIVKTMKILKLAERNINEFETNMKSIDDLLNRVADNMYYLSLLERSVKYLLSEIAWDDFKKALFDTFVILKVVWVQSEYYSNDENMCRLLKGISMLLQERVRKRARMETLFRKPLIQISAITEECIDILKYWETLYLGECEKVKKYGGSYWWRFDTRILFDETDHLISVCTDLGKVSQTLQELHNIFKTNLRFFVEDMKELSSLQNRIFGMTAVIQYADIDAFDSKFKSAWDRIMRVFFRDVKSFEDHMKIYIGNMFQSSLSWENAYILSKSFDKFSISPSIREFILTSRTDMLKQFIREVSETENVFLSRERDPPHFDGIPETASAILWVRDLLIKISRPMTKISDSLSKTAKDIEVRERYKRTEKMLTSFQKDKYETWKLTAQENLNKFLQTHLLKKLQPKSSILISTTRLEEVVMYIVNFPIYLEEVSIDAKILEKLGYDIPSYVKNVILQEKTFYLHRNKLTVILEELSESLSSLKKEEVSILGIPIENLSSVLDLGVNQIQWESTDIPEFLKKSKRAVDIFRGTVKQIKNIAVEIDKNIKLLSTCDLFQFMSIENSIPTCEAFFGDAEINMEKKVQTMVNIYSSLEFLLKKIEMISCKTSTGKSVQMREYYYACEENILRSLTMMMQTNLEYFKDEILERFIFPYVETAFKSNDELITSSLMRIKLIFLTFMKYAVESTRKLVRWLDGTCIKSPPFHLAEKNIQLEFSYYLDLSIHPQIKKMVLNILSNFFDYVDKQNPLQM